LGDEVTQSGEWRVEELSEEDVKDMQRMSQDSCQTPLESVGGEPTSDGFGDEEGAKQAKGKREL
jgi:hypothetical protein